MTVNFSKDKTTFSRQGSFRQAPLTERMADPQTALVPEPVPIIQADHTHAVNRPHASQDMLARQGSFRGFSKLNQTSPFKRQLSLRLNELPSNLERTRSLSVDQGSYQNNGPELQVDGSMSPIQEASPTKENNPDFAISAMCQQLTQGLTALDTDDPFASVPKSQQQQHTAFTVQAGTAKPANSANQVFTTQVQTHSIPQPVQPVREINPWAQTTPSKEDFWLSSGTPQQQTNGMDASFGQFQQPQQAQQPFTSMRPPLHTRSHSIDTGDLFQWNTQKQNRKPTLAELSRQHTIQNGTSSMNTSWQSNTTNQWQTNNVSVSTQPAQPGYPNFDPFDAAWAAAKTGGTKSTNPFKQTDSSGDAVKAFEVKL